MSGASDGEDADSAKGAAAESESTPPVQPGELREVAPGIFLIANPVAFPPGYQNAYVLSDTDQDGAACWTIVDPGLSSALAHVERRLREDLPARPVRRVVATHHHPDHIGAAGPLQERGAELLTTRTAWLYARMLHLDASDRPAPEAERFYARAGFDEEQLDAWRERSRLNFAAMIAPLPLGFRQLRADDQLTIGGREWRVLIGHGHAPDHLLLWCEADGLLLAGDQILPTISPNIGVYPAEPEADSLGDWLTSCRALAKTLEGAADTLVLPGHGDPFHGAAERLERVASKHEAALDRLEAFLDVPRTVVECFQPMFRRTIPSSHEGLAVGETLSHLHRLIRQGRARRRLRGDGVYEFLKP